MPLLLCPNDNSSMQTVHRSGVEFEMCPTCRGVWLDRGELEKMMEAALYSRPIDPPQDARPEPRLPDYDRPRRGREGRWDDDDDHHRRRKRRGLDIFDIFD